MIKLAEILIKFFKNIKCSRFIVIQSTFTYAKFISSFIKKFKKPIFLYHLKKKEQVDALRLKGINRIA